MNTIHNLMYLDRHSGDRQHAPRWLPKQSRRQPGIWYNPFSWGDQTINTTLAEKCARKSHAFLSCHRRQNLRLQQRAQQGHRLRRNHR